MVCTNPPQVVSEVSAVGSGQGLVTTSRDCSVVCPTMLLPAKIWGLSKNLHLISKQKRKGTRTKIPLTSLNIIYLG